MIQAEVHGRPATKGSLRRGYGGKLVESHASSAPWRAKVTAALRVLDVDTIDGPVEVHLSFRFACPARPRFRDTPATHDTGDIDKLSRNVLDSLVDAGVIRDDSRVVRLVADKSWAVSPQVEGLSIRVLDMSQDMSDRT